MDFWILRVVKIAHNQKRIEINPYYRRKAECFILHKIIVRKCIEERACVIFARL